LTREDDLEHGRHIVRFKVRDIADKIPLIVGDFLYCLRSSLDQLVWQLAKAGGVAYPEGTQFPIFHCRNEKRFDAYTFGVPAGAVGIIDSLQPYHGGTDRAIKSHLLWRLNALCNIDKHRRVPVNATVVDFNFPDFPHELLHLAVFDHDAEMVSVPLPLKRYMALDPAMPVNVVFGDSHEGIRCAFDGLEAIYEFVTYSVIPRFARFLQ
jgi:hypothetical protein